MTPDLNLLRVFDILMEVRSVSRAAERLGLTQSAVSHALARLRFQLDDPLFVRTRSGLRPTHRANDIAPSIREGLSLLRGAASRVAFDPTITTRVFTVVASSYFCVTILPVAIERARAEAPLAQFRVLAPGSDLRAGLDDGTIDIAFGIFREHPERFTKAVLIRERVVWVGRSGSDMGKLDTRPRLVVGRTAQSIVEEAFMRDDTTPRPGLTQTDRLAVGSAPVTTHDPLSAGALVSSSDLVTLLPRQLAMLVTGRVGVEILAFSDEPEFDVSMLWHIRSTSDPAHLWLRNLFIGAGRSLT